MELFLLFYYSYGLLGSSGCGKTTLLRYILGRLQLAQEVTKYLDEMWDTCHR